MWLKAAALGVIFLGFSLFNYGVVKLDKTSFGAVERQSAIKLSGFGGGLFVLGGVGFFVAKKR